MPTLLLASHNPGKIRELKSLLFGKGIDLLTPVELNLNLKIQETGNTYAENAAIKANAYAQATGLATLADDSGLEVDVLGGAPGVRSARFSPLPGATDADRRTYLLANLLQYERPWVARFACTVALVVAPRPTFFAYGTCEGEIIPDERGAGGFGYDPIFYIPEFDSTMAELSMEEKNQISHRARAIERALADIKNLLSC